jgi:hypothetical protein
MPFLLFCACLLHGVCTRAQASMPLHLCLSHRGACESFNWQAHLAERADKCREKTEKIKEGLEQKKEAFTDLSNKKAQSINEKLVLCHSS